MFDLIPKNETTIVTMTSLELVDFINEHRKEGESTLRHDHFMAKVPKVLGEEGVPKFRDTHQNPQTGQTYNIYRFPKREACLMAMSYSYDLQAMVFDRMTALEEAAAKPAIDPMQVLNDPAAMRGLLLTYTEKVIALEERVGVLEPKAEALDLISASDGSLTYTEAAKVLGLKRKDMTARMHAEGWHYRLNGSWVAYDKHIKNGNLQYKEAKYTDENTGQECLKPYSHVTPRGLSRLALLFGKPLPPEVAQPADQNIRLAFFA